jgi:type II secretory pathway pseudopilin PulG
MSGMMRGTRKDERAKMNKKRSIVKYALIAIAIVIEMVLLSEIYPPASDHSGYSTKVIYMITDLDLPSLFMLAGLFYAIPFFFVTGISSLIREIRQEEGFNDYVGAGTRLVIGIILLLVLAIAIPNIFRFSARSKQGEAKQYLGAIYDAYIEYNRKYETYPSYPYIPVGDTVYNCMSIADWEPKGTIRYNYNCMNTEAFSPAFRDSPCPPGIITTATKDSFTIAACGNVDADTTTDVWTIDDAKHLRNVVDDVKK